MELFDECQILYNIRFVVSYKVDVNEMMIDFSIVIFLSTFLRDVNMSNTIEDAKMR